MKATTPKPATRQSLLAAIDPWTQVRRVGAGHQKQGVSAIRRLVKRLPEGEVAGLADADPEALVSRLVGGKPISESTRVAYLSHVRSFQRHLGGVGPAPAPAQPEVAIPCGGGHVRVRGLPEPLTMDHVRQIVRGLKLWVR